ncbi:MAG TPA: polysaccharide biosynthesis tyrosine autokinase, partial [Flavobacteriales bacterium]|nr:polysaccharide biosynthesis tyrosine autokinase [Flavobacteriales bacterium]
MIDEKIQRQSESFSQYKERITNFSNEFELGLFLYIARKSLRWVLLFLITSLLAAWLYLRYTPPVYESLSVIQISEENNMKQVIPGINSFEDEQSGVDKALELMRSEFLFKKSIEKLDFTVSFFSEGQILTENKYPAKYLRFSDLTIIDSTIFGERIDIFSNSNQITLNCRNQTFTTESGGLLQSPWFRARITVADPQTIQAIQSENKLYFVFNHPDQLLTQYFPAINVQVLNASAKTLQISMRDHNKAIAHDIVYAITHAFNEFALERKNESSKKILDFIDSQIDTVYTKLKNSELELQAFRQLNKVQNFEGVSKNYLERLTELEGQLLKVDIDEELIIEVERALKEYHNESDIYNVLSILSGTRFESELSGMVKELHVLILTKEKEKFSSTSKSTYMKSLDYQIDIQLKMINQAITSLKNQFSKRKGSLKDKIRQYETIYYGLPEKEIEHARMERMFAINEKYHTMLLEKKTEYEISLAGQTTGNQILEQATIPKLPVSPKKRMIVIAFFFIGILFSSVMIVIRYLMHNEITTLHEITRISNASLGILGIIPKYKEDIPVSQLIVDKNPKSLISEAFRTIRTNMQFLTADKDAKLVSVTSTISGEGKTFVAINLAGMIAFSGKKVVILDLDMRKPKIHIGFGTDNEVGMSSLLIGRDQLEQCIRKSEMENLHFITAGPIPPNPAELIINGKLDSILEELKRIYDIVIVDLPPVGLVTDGIPIVQMADYPIYVFRANYSKKNFVQNADRLVNENNIQRLSVVLNSVDTDRGSSGYNYGYGYGYGY